MKKIISMVAVCLFLHTGIAQKTEFIVSVNGNASFFRGKSAASVTTMYISDVPGAVPNITGDYYGKKAGLGANAELSLQRLNKKGFITGVATGYEVLKSKVNINQVASRIATPATGSSKLTHTFINLFPYIGKRFDIDKCAIELNLGADIGLPLSAHEKGEARTNAGAIFTTDTDQPKPSVDVRPRIQLKLQKKHLGIQSSFSIGLTEYYGKIIGGDPEAYSTVLRLGVFYIL